MPIHILTLTARHPIARDTIEFHFAKPEGFQFKAGQYGGFTLTHAKHLEPTNLNRRFSLANAPGDDTIVIATRLQQSAYKKELNALEIGGTIKFAGPVGNFTLHEDKLQPAVFIAGGIGITPFYSMLRQASLEKSQREFILFYGNQTLADAAYIEELKNLNLENFTFVPVLADGSESLPFESGYISYELIKKYVKDLEKPVFYVCGSPAMVSALSETLKELDIPSERTKVEDFPGY